MVDGDSCQLSPTVSDDRPNKKLNTGKIGSIAALRLSRYTRVDSGPKANLISTTTLRLLVISTKIIGPECPKMIGMTVQTDTHFAGLSSAETRLVAAGRDRRPGAPLNIPPVLASNFVLGTDRAYARDDSTPTWEALEEIVGLLEEGKSVTFASGMAGVAAVFDQLHAGSRVVLADDCYQGIDGLAESGKQKGLWSVSRLARRTRSHAIS